MPPVEAPLPPADPEAVFKDLDHRIWEVRRDACEELGQRGGARAIPDLLRKLEDPVGAVRFAAVEALGHIGDRSVVPHLLKLMEDPQFGAYGPIVEALGNLKAVEAIPVLIRILRDKDARTRAQAANILMVITRQVIPFKAKGTDEEREVGIQQWETWWRKNEATHKPPPSVH
jgi:HEAT repeat protein